MRSLLLIGITMAGSSALAAQQRRPATAEELVNQVKVTRQPGCDVTAGEETIVVCGRRDPEIYRVPEELREGLPLPGTGGESWDARARDFRESSRYDGQNVGPSGYLKHSLQRDREFRAERAERQRERREVERQSDRYGR